METELYDLLGVPHNATQREIRDAYKKLAKEFHPDKNPNTEEKFKEITFAHDVLSNPEKREIYDHSGRRGLQENAEGPSHSDSLFEELFSTGGIFGMGRRRRGKGEDTIHSLKVSLEQLYNGHTSKLQLTRNILCKTCNGIGGKKGSNVKCSNCRGSGVKVTYRQLGPGMMQQIQSNCRECNGEGEVINKNDRCKACNGKKLAKESKIIEVHIDKGMVDNQKIFFRGEGDQHPDIEPGDLIVVLSTKEHDRFTRIGDDLYLEHAITLTEALCGLAFPVKHLDGREIIIRNQPGQVIKPGDIKEVRSEGMPVYRNITEKGNLYVKFTITFPEAYFAPEEKILQLNGILPAKVEQKFDLTSEHVEEVNLHDCDFNQQERMNGTRSEAYDEDEPGHGGHGGPGLTCATQ